MTTGARRRAACVAMALLTSSLGTIVALATPAAGDIPTVSGSALGYYTDVGLFGGAQQREGAGQVVCTVPPANGNEGVPEGCFVVPMNATAEDSASPSVTLPASGGNLSGSKPEGAIARYGPASIFGGQYPNAANDPTQSQDPPPSGPLDVSTSGSTGPNGTVTSTATVSPGTQGTVDPNQPRGIGPGPVIADAVGSTCTASASGVVASTSITKGILVTTTDSTGAPATTEPVPANPPPNYTREGTINNVGDSFRVVYNERIVETDPVTGRTAITVNAVHMYLLGPTAVGDMVIAQSHCGVTSTPTTDGARYSALTPARILDTRDGTGAPAAPLGPGATVDLQVTGRGGVPASGVSAVVMNVTVTDPTAPGHLTAFPTGQTRPLASNLNFSAGQTVPNLVVVKLGAGGKVSLYSSAGSLNVIADVAGWYDAG